MASVRPAKVTDFDSIYEIECACFKNPWLKEPFFEDFCDNPDSFWWVAMVERKIVGFCGLWRQFDEYHIINVCVMPEFRRNRLGSELVSAMLSKADEENVKLLLLEVRVSNTAAIKLYGSFGFKSTYVRKKYYQDNDEDAIVMIREQ
jgi:ribosomal-protein-alanine N-acetyltransferase